MHDLAASSLCPASNWLKTKFLKAKKKSIRYSGTTEMKDTLGPSILSFTERLVESVYQYRTVSIWDPGQ